MIKKILVGTHKVTGEKVYRIDQDKTMITQYQTESGRLVQNTEVEFKVQ